MAWVIRQKAWGVDTVSKLPRSQSNQASGGCAGSSMTCWGPILDQTLRWPIESWAQDLWVCPVVTGTRALAVNPKSPVGCSWGPPWIRLGQASPMHAWLDWDLGSLGRCLELFVKFFGTFWNSLPSIDKCNEVNVFPAEYCIVTRWSMFFTSPVSDFIYLHNYSCYFMADHCMCSWQYRPHQAVLRLRLLIWVKVALKNTVRKVSHKSAIKTGLSNQVTAGSTEHFSRFQWIKGI